MVKYIAWTFFSMPFLRLAWIFGPLNSNEFQCNLIFLRTFPMLFFIRCPLNCNLFGINYLNCTCIGLHQNMFTDFYQHQFHEPKMVSIWSFNQHRIFEIGGKWIVDLFYYLISKHDTNSKKCESIQKKVEKSQTMLYFLVIFIWKLIKKEKILPFEFQIFSLRIFSLFRLKN